MLDVLALELLALGVVGPRQPFVDVQSSVEGPGDHQEAPADRLKQKPSNQESFKEKWVSYSRMGNELFRTRGRYEMNK